MKTCKTCKVEIVKGRRCTCCNKLGCSGCIVPTGNGYKKCGACRYKANKFDLERGIVSVKD